MKQLSDKDQELIQKYLGDTLTPSDRPLFENRIKDAAFNKELLFQAQLVDQLEELDKAAIRKTLKEHDAATSSTKTNQPKINNLIKIILFAAFLALCWIGYQSMQHNQSPKDIQQLAATHNYVYPPSEIQRGTTATEGYTTALKAYADKKYAEAASLFNLVEPKTETIYMYLANCYMQEKRYDKAEKIFQNLILSEDQAIKQNAEWYLAISALAQGNKELTKNRLNAIIAVKDHLFGEKARSIIKEL